MTYGSSVKIRPAAQRINGIHAVELEKFAMLNNLLITYILAIEQNEDKARLSELMSFLHEAKLMHVRYTQSTEELKLMKIAAYVKQRFGHASTVDELRLVPELNSFQITEDLRLQSEQTFIGSKSFATPFRTL